MTRPFALLRAGFPYFKTIGMRRMTNFPVDLAIGDMGRLYILLRGDTGNEIRIWHWDDKDLGSIGEMGSKPGQLTWPVAIVRRTNNNLIVSDEALHRISIFDQDGSCSYFWGQKGKKPGQLHGPAGLALHNDTQIYIADSKNHRIQKYTVEGDYVFGWGSYGSDHGQFKLPWGLAVDNIGAIYVADWGNNRVEKFSGNGEYLMTFGDDTNTSESCNLTKPSGIAVDLDGDVYVADWGNNRVVQFNSQGLYLDQFIGDATLSRVGMEYIRGNLKILRQREMTSLEPTKRLRRAPSVKIDDNGMMYIVDHGGHRIQIYKKEAQRLDLHEIMAEPNSPSLDTQ